jgi:hypothetical protein
VFGKVLDGLDLVDAISHIEVDAQSHPTLPVTIKAVGEIPVVPTIKAAAASAPIKAASTSAASKAGNAAAHTGAAHAGAAATNADAAKAAAAKAAAAKAAADKAAAAKAAAAKAAAAKAAEQLQTPGLKLESAPIKAPAGGPAYTRFIWFDLEQNNIDIGRVTFGL